MDLSFIYLKVSSKAQKLIMTMFNLRENSSGATTNYSPVYVHSVSGINPTSH